MASGADAMLSFLLMGDCTGDYPCFRQAREKQLNRTEHEEPAAGHPQEALPLLPLGLTLQHLSWRITAAACHLRTSLSFSALVAPDNLPLLLAEALILLIWPLPVPDAWCSRK